MCVHDIHLLAANKQIHRSACLIICFVPGQCLTIYVCVCTLWSLCFTITLENLDPFTQFFHHNILRETFHVPVLLFHMHRYTTLWNFKIQNCHRLMCHPHMNCRHISWISKISAANTKWFSQLFHVNSTKYKQAAQSGLETLFLTYIMFLMDSGQHEAADFNCDVCQLASVGQFFLWHEIQDGREKIQFFVRSMKIIALEPHICIEYKPPLLYLV